MIVWIIILAFTNYLMAAHSSDDLYLAHGTPILPWPVMEIGGLLYNLESQEAYPHYACTRPTIHWTVLGVKADRKIIPNQATAEDKLRHMPALMNKYVIIVPLSSLANNLIAGSVDDLYCLGPLEIDPSVASVFVPANEHASVAENYPNLKKLHSYESADWPDYNYIYSKLAADQIPHVVSNDMLIKHDGKYDFTKDLIVTIKRIVDGLDDNLVIKLSPVVISDNEYFLVTNKEKALEYDVFYDLHIEEDSPFVGLMDYRLILSNNKITTLLHEIDKHLASGLFIHITHGIDLVSTENALKKVASDGITSLEQLDNLFIKLKNFEVRFEHDPRDIIVKNARIFLDRVYADLFIAKYLFNERRSNKIAIRNIVYAYLHADAQSY